MTTLARAIRSLLRPQVGRPLGSAMLRPDLGPRLGVADWVPDRLGPYEPPGPTALSAMNSGWLRWELGDTPNYTVYADADEMTAFVIPGSSPERTERWSGKIASYDVDAPCQVGHYLPHWFEQPTLGTDLEYTPVETTVNVVDDPSLYTGLVKLWAQSVIGSGKTIASKLPTGWSADPKYLGMVREPLADVPAGEAPKWYLIQATSSGCWVAPLVLKTPAQCMARWIANGDLTGAALLRAEAWIFAVATVGDAVQIADASDMNAAYFYASHFVWGWYWASQKLGTAGQDEAKAVTVLATITGSGSAWRIQSRLARLAISWVDRVPVVTPSTEDHSSWTPGWATAASLMLPTSAVEWVRLVPPTGTAATGNGAVCAWLTSDGEEKKITFRYGDSYEESTEDAADSICGIGSSSASASGQKGSHLGWVVPGSAVSSAVHTEFLDYSVIVTVHEGESVTVPTVLSNQGPSWWATNCSPTAPNTYCWFPGFVSGDTGLCVYDKAASIYTTTPYTYSWPSQTNVFVGEITEIGHRTQIISGTGSNVLAPLITPGHVIHMGSRAGTYLNSYTLSRSGSFPTIRAEHYCYGNTAKHTISARPTGATSPLSGAWSSFNVEVLSPEAVLQSDDDAADWSWLTPDSSTTPRSGTCQVKASYGSNYYKAINDTATIANVDPAALGAQGFWVGAI